MKPIYTENIKEKIREAYLFCKKKFIVMNKRLHTRAFERAEFRRNKRKNKSQRKSKFFDSIIQKSTDFLHKIKRKWKVNEKDEK